MPRKAQQSSTDLQPLRLLRPRTEAKTQLTLRIEKGTSVAAEIRSDLAANRSDRTAAFTAWNTYNRDLLTRLFGESSAALAGYDDKPRSFVGSVDLRHPEPSDAELRESTARQVEKNQARLRSLIE